MDYQKTLNSFDFQTNQEPTTEESRTATELGIKSPEMPTLNEKTISEIKAGRDGVQVAGIFEDLFVEIIKGGFDGIRSETVGRMHDQFYVGELSVDQLESLKNQHGGDYRYVVSDWCNNLVSQSQYSGAITTPYIGSTWRQANDGKINCYARQLKR